MKPGSTAMRHVQGDKTRIGLPPLQPEETGSHPIAKQHSYTEI